MEVPEPKVYSFYWRGPSIFGIYKNLRENRRMPCNETKRERVLQANPKFRSITSIPSTAYLVVGSTPGEPRRGRTFYDNPAYFLTDMDKKDRADRSRFIECNFMEVMESSHIAFAFCERFDTVICDYSVFHHFGSTTHAKTLFSMVKPGGTLILDNTGYIGMRGMPIEEAITTGTEKIKGELVSLGLPVEVQLTVDLISNNPVAKEIYGPLIEANIMRNNSTCFVMVKPKTGGKRKFTGRKRNTKRSRKIYK